MEYYKNGQLIEDLKPSCIHTSMKQLAANKGIQCSWIEGRVILYNNNIAVAMNNVAGVVQFIQDHFGVRI